MNIKFDNQYKNYPIVLLPENILTLLNSEIDETKVASILNISKPQKVIIRKPESPAKYTYQEKKRVETELSEHFGCVPLVFLAAIVFSIFVTDSLLDWFRLTIFGTLGYLVFFSLLLLLNGEFLIKFKSRKDYLKVPRSLDELDKLENDYRIKLNQYNLNCKSNDTAYQVEIKTYLKQIELNKYKIKKNLYLNSLTPKLPATRGSVSLKRGTAELFFLKQLDLELRGLIFVDMVPLVNFAGRKNIYNPDFTLICKLTKLHIDIEIDEPYSMNEKQPIHYIGSSDEKRNDFFLGNNWCIIRFSENQIIQNTAECIETIKSIYNNLIEMNLCYKSTLPIIARWSYEDSLIMQKNRYRESYLNIDNS